jgi:glycosyltransferase involved in cell wall biosynthesis
MRLGLVLDQILFEHQGRYSTDEAFIRFVEAAARPSFDRIDFCSRVWPGDREGPYVLEPARFDVRRLPWYPNVPALCLRSPVLLPRIARLFAAWLPRWDMVMACGIDPVTAVVLRMAQRRRIPTQLWIRGDLPSDIAHKYAGFRRLAALAIARITTASIPDRTPIVSIGRCDYPFLDRMGGVHVAFSSKFGAEDIAPEPRAVRAVRGPLRLLYVGRISAEKGLEVLIHALEQLADRRPDSFTLTIVGDDFVGSGYGNRFRARIAASRVRSIVNMRGYVPFGPALWEVYDSHDVLVLASFTEGFPQAVLEGMARGMPVIAAAAGGVPTLVRDGENGLLIPPGQPAALAHAVSRLADDPDLRRRLSRGGLICAAAHARGMEVAAITEFTTACLRGAA